MWTAWCGLRDSNWRGLLRGRSLEWHLRKENNMKRQLGSFWTKWNCSDLLVAKPEIKNVCSSIPNPGRVLELWWPPSADWVVKRTSWSWAWGSVLSVHTLNLGIATAPSSSEGGRFRWGVICLCINIYVLMKTLAIWGVLSADTMWRQQWLLRGHPIPQGPTWDAGSQSEPHVSDGLWPHLSSR